MDRKSALFHSILMIVGSMILISTTSSGLSNTFEAYADDNCDASSTCTNIPGTDTQHNNCNGNSACQNLDIGMSSSNTQTNNCSGSSLCTNNAGESDNTQTNICNAGSRCSNQFGETDNTQNTICQASERCLNFGTNTNVYANSATDDCRNGDPNTTTICQGNRVFVFPNH